MPEKSNIQAKLDEYTELGKKYLLSLRDVRNVGVLVFVIIVLLISWSGAKAIQTNYGLQKQISRLQQENDVAKLENANLNLRNQYYNTDQYLELTARANLGLGMPGETELLVPKSVALAHTVPEQSAEAVQNSTVPKQPFWQHNFEAWVDFLLHRGTTD